MLSRTLTQAQRDMIAGRIVDLGQHGIHIDNPTGICYRCGGDTTAKTPTDFSWSSGVHMDARCWDCFAAESRDGITPLFDPIYTPASVYAIKVEPDQFGRQYDIVVKIDGRLYIGTGYHMATYALVDAVTGVLVHKPGLQMSDWEVQSWYEERIRTEAAKTAHNEEMAIRWLRQEHAGLDVEFWVEHVPYGRYTWDSTKNRHIPLDLTTYRSVLGSFETLCEYLRLVPRVVAKLQVLDPDAI